MKCLLHCLEYKSQILIIMITNLFLENIKKSLEIPFSNWAIFLQVTMLYLLCLKFFGYLNLDEYLDNYIFFT